MSASTIIFYLLAAITLGSGLLAVTSRQIFRSAIYLLFSLIGVAGLYFWLQYEFIAAVQIVVYVGGIVVLIIFSIFLTQQSGEQLPKQSLGRQVFSALAAFCGFALIITQILKHEFPTYTGATKGLEVSDIGRELLNIDQSGMALPFELISILLLAAMIACIVIAIKQPKSENEITA